MADDLIARIEETFVSAVRPSPASLTVPPGAPDAASGALRGAFGNRRWRDLNFRTLRYHMDAMSLLAPDAWHYYLPAFLRTAVQTLDWEFRMDVAQRLAPMPPGRLQDWQMRRFITLTAPEREVVRQFVELMWREYGDEDICGDLRATLDFWRTLAPGKP